MSQPGEPLLPPKVPPYSLQAEQSVLGGLMLDAGAWEKIADRVSEADFYRKEHRLIFRAIQELVENDSPCDGVTVSEVLEKQGLLQAVGGLTYLASLLEATPSSANITAYAAIVRERAILRQLAHVGTEIADAAFNPAGREVGELLEEAERKVFHIADQRQRGDGGFKAIKHLLVKAVDRIEQLHEQGGSVTGVSTGFIDLDRMTAGLQPADLIIVAGRPSMGKTAFAMCIAEHVAIKEQLPVAVFSMEMPGDHLAMRMLSSLGRIDQHRLRIGQLEDDEWPRMTSALNLLAGTRLFIDDTPALTPVDLRARSRRLAREHGKLGLVVVDYLQLMQAPGAGDNRVAEISEISRSLKGLAKELNTPVLALSQLNRNLEQRPNKRPVMSDLRECVTGDMLVCLTDGRRVAIRDLVGTTPEVWSVAGDQRIVAARSDRVWKVGRRPVYRLVLACGRELRATREHRVLSSAGWRTMSELKLGDRIALSRRLPELVSVADAQILRTAVSAERGGTGHCRFAPSREALADEAEILDDSGLRRTASDLSWDRVVAVLPDGEEDVYDLTVPGFANWLADGIVTHNSGSIEQDADLIVFIYRDEVYHQDSPDKGIAEIIIAKQRNGPIGMMRLTFLGQYTRFENFTQDPYAEDDRY